MNNCQQSLGLQDTGRKGYRKNVAALLEVGSYFLACERTNLPNAWQCVQGGVNGTDQTLEGALMRELSEELGARAEAFSVKYKSTYWRRYLFPPGLPARVGENHAGQDQMWFHVQMDSLSSVDLARSDGEFCQVKLVPLSELVSSFAHWKRALLSDFCHEIGLI